MVGAPGAGKSTLLRYLAYQTSDEKDQLPIFLELKTVEKQHFDTTKGRLAEIVFDQTLGKYVCETGSDLAAAKKAFYRKLEAGEVSIFLDGLDEVSGESFFSALRESVKDFLQTDTYRQNRLYISTRPYALLDRFSPNEAQEMEIAPLNQEQIEQFVQHYYPGQSQPAKFLEELRQHADLLELASVPALLGFLILFYRRDGSTPENRLDLYNYIVLQLAREWDKEKAAKRDFQTADILRLDFLRHLAFAALVSQSGQALTQRFIFSSLRMLQEAQHYCASRGCGEQADILTEEVTATALLRQVGNDSYAFAHLTIQEYLAATVLAEQEDRSEIFCRSYFDSTISEMELLPMSLGLSGEHDELHKALDRLPNSLDFKKLRLEARTLKYGKVPNHVRETLVRTLTDMVTEDEVEFGYFKAVVKSFRSAVSPIAQAISEGVGKALTNEADVYRSRAVQILGLLGNDSADQLLCDALEDSDSSVRIEAATFLASKNSDKAFESLMKDLKSDDVDVRQDVVYALWQIGSNKAIECLKIAIGDDNGHIRRLVYEALAGLADLASLPLLVEGLKDPDEWVRTVVVEQLGELGGDIVIGPLMKATEDADFSVAKRALRFLGRIGSDDAVHFLRDFVNTHSGQVIGPAAEALGILGDKQSISKLLSLLKEYKRSPTQNEPISLFTGGWKIDYVRVRVARALMLLAGC